MSSLFDRLRRDQLIPDAPRHMYNNVHYECIMGSVAYGVSDETSDVDVYGFSMPPKDILFPYDYGNLFNFGKKPKNFEQFQKHHIIDTRHDKEYDISIYNIVRYFQLCMENNPNMIDSLFVPLRCVLHATSIGQHVREHRHEFLSKRVWHTFKGYAYSQLHKMKTKYVNEWVDLCKKNQWDLYISREDIDKHWSTSNQSRALELLKMIEHKGKRSKRLPMIAEHGYDTKFAYHLIRLADECEQLLETGTMDLTQNREQLKSIRRGEWTMDQIIELFDKKILHLEDLYRTSKLPYSPNEDKIRRILMECIEMHYGSVNNSIEYLVPTEDYLNDINKYINDMLTASTGLNRALTGYKR